MNIYIKANIYWLIIILYNSSITDIEHFPNYNTFNPPLTHQVRLWQPYTIVIYIYIYIYIHTHTHIQENTIYRYMVPSISFQAFFVWALLLIVHTWNSSPLWSNFLQLQCTCCTLPTTSRRPHRCPFVWACQWRSSQPLSSPQLSHNNSL